MKSLTDKLDNAAIAELLSARAEEAAFPSPTVALLGLASLTPLTSQLADFVFHDELHQLQPGLPHQRPDPFLQSGGNLLQRQMQLDLAIPLLGHLLKSANRLLAVNLVSSLHSDSPFS